MTEKIAMSLDEQLLEEIERVRGRTGESRSALIRRALDMLLETERRRQRISEYVEGYRRRPEPEKMVAAAFDQTRAAWSMLEDGDDW